MSRKFLLVFVLSVFLVSVPYLSCEQKTLTILHSNDTHSALFPFGPLDYYGGIARMSTLIKSLKAKDPNVLVLHSGDASVGSFEFNKYLGYPEFKIMQKLYDAMELGNHEFDLGIDVLTGVLSGAISSDAPITMPFLCANIDLISYPALANFVKPSIIIDKGGMKIGIVGVVTVDPQNYSPEVAALLEDPFNAAGIEAATLRAQGCGIVICVSHLGQMYDVAGLSQVPGIDIIIGGHSHDALTSPIMAGGKIIVQAGDYGRYLGELKVNYDGVNVTLKKYVLHKVNGKVPKDPKLLNYLNGLRTGIVQDPRFGPVYTQRVATADVTMKDTWETGNPYRDTALGNLVADSLKAGVQNGGYAVDIGLEVMGYTAYQLNKGKIVGNDILRCVPYGYDPTSGLNFKINIIDLDGGTLLALLEFSVANVEYLDDFSLEPSGLTFQYDSSKPPAPLGEFSRLDLTSVLVNGQPVDPGAHYLVAVNEQVNAFLASMGVTPHAVTQTGLFEYNLVRDFVDNLNHVNYHAEGRIIDTAIQ